MFVSRFKRKESAVCLIVPERLLFLLLLPKEYAMIKHKSVGEKQKKEGTLMRQVRQISRKLIAFSLSLAMLFGMLPTDLLQQPIFVYAAEEAGADNGKVETEEKTDPAMSDASQELYEEEQKQKETQAVIEELEAQAEMRAPDAKKDYLMRAEQAKVSGGLKDSGDWEYVLLPEENYAVVTGYHGAAAASMKVPELLSDASDKRDIHRRRCFCRKSSDLPLCAGLPGVELCRCTWIPSSGINGRERYIPEP